MTAAHPRTPLADPGRLGDGRDEAFFDCVVVGSGFGGAVTAARLAPHLPPGGLAVLERGREFRPGDFPRTGSEAVKEVRSPRRPLGLFDFGFSADIDHLVGNGLGGGSLIYANVALEPLPGVFDARMSPADSWSPRRWPASIRHPSLATYYARVRQMLAVEKYVDEEDVRRGDTGPDPALIGSFFHGAEKGVDPATGLQLTDHQGRQFGLRPTLRRIAPLRRLAQDVPDGPGFRKVPIAVNLTRHHEERNEHGVPRRKCTLCGNCVIGCNVGAKNDLTTNYLPVARAGGARLFTQVEVTHVTESTRPGYRYCVHALCREPRGRRLAERLVRIHTKLLIISAGVLGTAGILLTSARRGPLRFSAALGTGFSGNGDTFCISYDGSQRMDAAGHPETARPPDAPVTEPGPTIIATTDLRTVRGAGFIVQDSAIPAIAASGLRPALGADPLDRSTVWLAVGHDDARGELRLDRKGRVRAHWPTAAAQPSLIAAQTIFAYLARICGGRLMRNPRELGVFARRAGTPITVHPLGGCRMAESAADGVVDDIGRVYRPDGSIHPGLYVCDASICDGSLGANPSLTIAALAERAVERIAADDLSGLLQPGQPADSP